MLGRNSRYAVLGARTPIELMKAQGFEPLALAYNEGELRDKGGRWTAGGGAGVNVAAL